MLKCGTGDTQTISFANAVKNPETGRIEAEFTCGETVAECSVHDKPNTTSEAGFAWRTSNSCKDTGTAPICGNGVVETGEQCDNTTNICGQPGTTNQCKILGGGGS